MEQCPFAASDKMFYAEIEPNDFVGELQAGYAS
jgi:hypothetical protein